MAEANIFDFLTFKNVKREYGDTENLNEKISKIPVTLRTKEGEKLMVYLLVKRDHFKDRVAYKTISNSPYVDISLEEEQIVCDRFDSTEPTIYDLEGHRINEDSKLKLSEPER